MDSIVVVMPAFNEEEGIAGFLRELESALRGLRARFIVIDDASDDGTGEELVRLASIGFPLEVITNERDLGHGPSTLRALAAGVAAGADVVVAVDGDGQFRGEDVAAVARRAVESDVVVEGVRIARSDPWFRRAISAVTRFLVAASSASRARDANTPLRAYPVGRLVPLLSVLPTDLLTPNLLISSILRRRGETVVELEVTSLPRRGADATGSTWGAARRSLPNRRLIRFCIGAFRQWIIVRGGRRLDGSTSGADRPPTAPSGPCAR